MKMLLSILAGALAMASLGVEEASPGLQAVEIVGQITDASTGAPVEMVQVFLPEERIGAQTNAEGKFILRSRRGGEALLVRIEHPRFHSVQVDLQPAPSADSRRLDIGISCNYEEWGGASAPLGAACGH